MSDFDTTSNLKFKTTISTNITSPDPAEIDCQTKFHTHRVSQRETPTVSQHQVGVAKYPHHSAAPFSFTGDALRVCVCVKLWINVLCFFGYKREQNRKQWKKCHTHTHLLCGKRARLSWNVKGYHGSLQFKFYETFYCERKQQKSLTLLGCEKGGSPLKIFDSRKKN